MAAAVTGLIAAAIGHALRARHVTPYVPVLEQIEHRLPTIAKGLSGLKIGFVTDLHLGPVMRAADVDRALRRLFTAEIDLLLLGGDYICESPRHAADAAAVVGQYVPQTSLGAFAVLGNHDHSNDAPRLTRMFERHGIRVLRNESATVTFNAATIWVVGIDDAILGSPDPARAFSNLPPDAAALAIWHEPDWAEQSAQQGAFLQLSGHSHGGQVRIPGLGALAAPPGGRRFVTGFNQVNGMPVYTSRGVGVYRPPVRYRCPPEVTQLTLV